MLVGNKNDEMNACEVESSDGETVARRWKCAFMETSAKTNHNVKELFQELLHLEKRRTVSLQIDGKKSKQQKRAEKLKGKCVVMWKTKVCLENQTGFALMMLWLALFTPEDKNAGHVFTKVHFYRNKDSVRL